MSPEFFECWHPLPFFLIHLSSISHGTCFYNVFIYLNKPPFTYFLIPLEVHFFIPCYLFIFLFLFHSSVFNRGGGPAYFFTDQREREIGVEVSLPPKFDLHSWLECSSNFWLFSKCVDNWFNLTCIVIWVRNIFPALLV